MSKDVIEGWEELLMASAIEQPVSESRSQKKQVKWFKNWKYITTIIVIIIALILAAMSYYQANHFNTNVSINSVDVSGLTAEDALEELKNYLLKNEVYIGDQLIIDGEDTKMGFTNKDLPEVQKLLKTQWTFFPSFKTEDYDLTPTEQDHYRSEVLKVELEEKLLSMNKELTAPKDARAVLEKGEITISKSVDGKQYDAKHLLEEFDKQTYASTIQLEPAFLLPIKEDSEIVKKEAKRLEELLAHTVEYKVQDKVHSLKGSDFITDATVSKDLEVSITSSELEDKIEEINDAQSTLGKNFTFITHAGKEIKVKGQGYGWALDVKKEAALVQTTFEKGEKSVDASNIIGNGWVGEGYGYDVTSNYGIGDTYAEISISEQKIWLYRNGELVLSTNVVTGKHSTGEGTSPGVWYILFKRTPYTLEGSAVGNPNYSVEVDYWAPFTNSGQGFHDAGWRTNWNSNAYLNAGSGGCVNVQPHMMKQVYNNLEVYQPVVVY